MANLGAYDHFFFAALAIFGSIGGAWFLIWFSQKSRYATWAHSLRGVAPNFLSVVGVMFALNLVFLANDTWHARDRALDAVYQEADSLSAILVLAGHLPEPARAEVAAALRGYANAAATYDWPAFARRRASPEAGAALDALLSVISSRDVSRGLAQGVYAEMVRQALAVRTARETCISVSQTHVNPLKWMSMAFLGFVMMISLVAVHVDAGRAEIFALALFVAAAAPTAAIVLIQGNPFQAPAAVSVTPIAAIADAR